MIVNIPLIPFEVLNKNNRIYSKGSIKNLDTSLSIPIKDGFDEDSNTIGQGKLILTDNSLLMDAEITDPKILDSIKKGSMVFASCGASELGKEFVSEGDNLRINFIEITEAVAVPKEDWSFSTEGYSF